MKCEKCNKEIKHEMDGRKIVRTYSYGDGSGDGSGYGNGYG